MNEFNTPSSAQAEELNTPVVERPSSAGFKHYAVEKKYFFGLTAPWLLGLTLLLAGFFWYLLGPQSMPGQDVNNAAGFEDSQVEPVQSPAQPDVAMSPASAESNSQIKSDVANMVNGVREYAQANRTAVQRLSDTVKDLQQQLQNEGQLNRQYQSDIEMLKTRISTLEANRVNFGSPMQSRTKSSPIAGMRLNSIQEGAAWLYWNGSTWSVREGDTIAHGKVRIDRIDAENRQVFTSAGVVR